MNKIEIGNYVIIKNIDNDHFRSGQIYKILSSPQIYLINIKYGNINWILHADHLIVCSPMLNYIIKKYYAK